MGPGRRNDFWDAVAPVYDRVVAAAGWHRVLDALEAALPGGRVLEVGCGPAHLAPALLGRGVHYVGLDLSPAMLDRAARGLGKYGRPLVCADLSALPFPDGAFDAVVATAVLGLLGRTGRHGALREIARVVRGEVWLLEPVRRPGEPAHRARARAVALARDGPLELAELTAVGLVPRVEGRAVLLATYSVVRATRSTAALTR